MNKLDISKININSPYKVWNEGDIIYFVTESGIKYAVDFDDDNNPYYTAFWLNLKNESNKKSPGDRKIPQTLICIIEDFFRQNQDVLLYMCSTAGGQQAQRARLFLRWFNGAEQQKHYVVRAAEVKGEGHKEYVALIAQRSNPNIEDILEIFEEELAMFNEYKPGL